MVGSSNPRNPHWRERRRQYYPMVEAMIGDGRNIAAIARELGVSRKLIASCITDLGLENPNQYALNKAEREAYYIGISRMYTEGISVLEMAARINKNRTFVVRCLHEIGVTPRSGSEANYLRMARLSATERRKLARNANAASRNEGKHRESLRATAKRRQERHAAIKIGEFEAEIGEHLASQGIEAIPQYAFDVNNIDFFIPSRRVAVEVYTSTQRPAQVSKAAKKTMQILCAGISLCDVWIRRAHGERPTPLMYENLIAFIQEARPLPSGLGAHRVIRGYGDIDPISESYLDELTDIAICYRALKADGRNSD